MSSLPVVPRHASPMSYGARDRPRNVLRDATRVSLIEQVDEPLGISRFDGYCTPQGSFHYAAGMASRSRYQRSTG